MKTKHSDVGLVLIYGTYMDHGLWLGPQEIRVLSQMLKHGII